jgi:hypothetical protein
VSGKRLQAWLAIAAGLHHYSDDSCWLQLSLCVPKNGVTSGDLGIFVDQAAEPAAAPNAHTSYFRRRMSRPCRRVLLQCPVRPMAAVTIDVLAQDQPQVPFASDQHPVQALAAGTGNPALRDRVRTRRPDRRPDDPHCGRGEHSVERRGELGIPVPNQELEPPA